MKTITQQRTLFQRIYEIRCRIQKNREWQKKTAVKKQNLMLFLLFAVYQAECFSLFYFIFSRINPYKTECALGKENVIVVVSQKPGAFACCKRGITSTQCFYTIATRIVNVAVEAILLLSLGNVSNHKKYILIDLFQYWKNQFERKISVYV